MRVLLAEDEPQLRDTIARGLREQAHVVDAVADGDAAFVEAMAQRYDAIILDVVLPRRSGIEVCAALRARGQHTPILLLTARDAIEDKVAGLDAGADDYLTKPFVLRELLARVRALGRRRGAVLPSILRVGDLEVDTLRKEARRQGQLVDLTAREFAFLAYLAQHAEQVISRAELSAEIWDDAADPSANLIDVYVSRIRRKLDAAGQPTLLHTRRGQGVLLSAQAPLTDGALGDLP
jgi:DNA-binding response OmpR family regulator